MRVVIRHSGTVDIEFYCASGFVGRLGEPEPDETGDSQAYDGKAQDGQAEGGQAEGGQAEDSGGFRNLAASSSLEDALFLGLVLLLERHYEHTGIVPTRTVLMTARQVFEALEERGNIPDTNTHDSRFLAKLLAILEQLSRTPFVVELIAFVRRMLINDAKESASEDIGSGNDHPSNGKPRPRPNELDDDGATTGGSNGEPDGSNGEPDGSNGESW